jgi:hypothetical protein
MRYSDEVAKEMGDGGYCIRRQDSGGTMNNQQFVIIWWWRGPFDSVEAAEQYKKQRLPVEKESTYEIRLVAK